MGENSKEQAQKWLLGLENPVSAQTASKRDKNGYVTGQKKI
jgi:hypothetical protein